MHNPVLPRSPTPSDDRRRHVRHHLQPFSTVIVELGPNNGGNLLDISGGGLSLQAVAKLLPQMELTLSFRLQGIEHAIKTVGLVTWVGPTQKVAGISFKNLPGSTEQQIVEWVSTQQRSAQNNSSRKSNDAPFPPSHISPQEIREIKPDASPPPSLSISVHGTSPQTKIVLPRHKSLESLAQLSKPALDMITLSKSAQALSSRRSVSLDPLLISPADANSTATLTDSLARGRLRESFTSDFRRRRRKIAIAIVVCMMGILALLVVTSQRTGLVDRLKGFFGVGVQSKMDPAKANVPVWIALQDGYYYCADNPNFKTLQPGAVMTQGEALQYSYKPKLGYCQ